VADQEAPKSAYEIAMARLKKKDQEEGVVDRPVTDAQRAAIAEARKVAEARLAEREIMHRSQLAKAADPEAFEKLEAEYRRDRERIASERDHKIEERQIKVGLETPTQLEVKSGVEENELVLIGGRGQYQPGQMAAPKLLANGAAR